MMSDPYAGETSAQSFERAERLAILLQAVGYAVWQAAECEDALAHLCLISLRDAFGVGATAGDAMLAREQKRTMGSLTRELIDAGVIPKEIEPRLRKLVENRNWVIHKAKRESRGVVTDGARLKVLLQRLAEVADEALSLMKEIAAILDRAVIARGVTRESLDAQAAALIDTWGY